MIGDQRHWEYAVVSLVLCAIGGTLMGGGGISWWVRGLGAVVGFVGVILAIRSMWLAARRHRELRRARRERSSS